MSQWMRLWIREIRRSMEHLSRHRYPGYLEWVGRIGRLDNPEWDESQWQEFVKEVTS